MTLAKKTVLRIILIVLIGSALGGTYLFKVPVLSFLPTSWQEAIKGSSGSLGSIILHGNVDIRYVNLSFRVGGTLTELFVDEGDEITAGQKIAALDKQPFEIAVKQATASRDYAIAQLALVNAGYRDEEIAQVKAELEKAEAAKKYAEQYYQRQMALFNQQLIARNQLDEAKNNLDQAISMWLASKEKLNLYQAGNRQEQIEAAKANLAIAEATLESAQLDLADSELLAPQNGQIMTRIVEPGTIINAGSNIVTLALNDSIWVRTYINETELGFAKPGSSVSIYTDSRPNHAYQGTIGYVSPTAEFTPKNIETEELRTDLVYRVRILVKENDGLLRQGMPVTIKLNKSE